MGEEELKAFKPLWSSYLKRYGNQLSKRIMHEIGGDLFVIKPRRGALRRGVTITDREGLDGC